MDSGEEPVTDGALDERLRAQARRINRRALLTAAGITLVALVFPSSL